MRFRNVKPRENTQVVGNSKTALTGRDVRSRLFAAMDQGSLFSMPTLRESQPILRLVDEDGVETPVENPTPPVEWEIEEPNVPLTDTLPPEKSPTDLSRIGLDRPEPEPINKKRFYTVNSTTVNRDLSVSGATAANCAQVLSALLLDLQRSGQVVIRTEP